MFLIPEYALTAVGTFLFVYPKLLVVYVLVPAGGRAIISKQLCL